MHSLLFALLTLGSIAANASPVYLETYDSRFSRHESAGWVLRDNDSYLGIRFSVDEYLNLDSIVANLGGQGSFFTAITAIDDMSSLPSVAPGFAADSLLFYAENEFAGNVATDIRTNVGITLGAGSYVVFFGGLGEFGVNDYGWMPAARAGNVPFNIPLNDYLEFRSENNGWVEFPESEIYVALEGQATSVPVPASVWLFSSGLGLLGWLKRKQPIVARDF